MVHDLSHWCQQSHFGISSGCSQVLGENPLNGTWLVQAWECFLLNSVLGNIILAVSHDRSVYTTEISKFCKQFFLPESQSLNVIQPTAGPGGMKGSGGWPFCLPHRFPMETAAKHSLSAPRTGHLLHRQRTFILPSVSKFHVYQ